MKTKLAIKLVVLGILIVAAGHWLRGHDVLTALALCLLFLAVVFKVSFALIVRRSGGDDSAYRPEPRPPGGRPPVLSAAEEEPREQAA